MQASIEVRNDYEAEVITQALAEPDIRAFLLVAMALRSLSPRGRQRVLAYVADLIDENEFRRQQKETHAETPNVG